MLSATPASRRGPARLRTTALLGVLALTGCTQTVPGSAAYAPPGAEGQVTQRPCAADEFDCVTVGVPADHFAPDSPTWQVTFAVHRAPVESLGTVVVATGGPGSSGIIAAPDRLAAMSPEITDHYDVVFFDQRGIGRSEPFLCDEALSGGGEPIDSSATAAERDAFAEDAEQFATDCFEEAGVDPAHAGRYSTTQAVEDLEVFREWLGVDRLVLYGESYGTQYVQTYAAAHPERVQALVLDGVVDLASDSRSNALELARTYSAVLTATLSACDADIACAGDAPGSALEQFDRLAADLAEQPARFDFPLPDGRTDERELTLGDLRSAAAWSLSDPGSRSALQGALNAAAGGNLVPLARLVAASWGADPEDGTAYVDPGFSPALYFAVDCTDYDSVPAGSTGRAELDAWLDVAVAQGVDQQRLGDTFYGALPCLFWPDSGATAARPAPVTDPPYPLLVLTADTDVNTPSAAAERVHQRTVGEAALVLQQGGPHVVYGRGEPCIDDAVTTLVTTGALPAERTTVCPGDLTYSYAPNPPDRPARYVDPYATVDAVLSGTLGNATYASWLGEGNLALGCDAGGSARYRTDRDGVVRVVLFGCAWTEGAPVDGALRVDDGGYGDVSGTITLPFAELTFEESGELTGTFRGSPVG